MPQSHETLVAWQRADDLCVEIYSLTKRFPVEERFALSDQMRRAAFSAAANIVEGYAFPKSPTRLRFLRIAVASLAEVGYAVHLCKRIGYVTAGEWKSLDLRIRQTAAPLHGLIKQERSAVKSGS